MPEWRCAQTGECCRRVSGVVMTLAERAVLLTATDRPLRFRPHSEGFVELQAGPCPLLDGSRCSVYAVRPYNCRRWGCFRTDLSQAPDIAGPIPVHVLTTRPLRRQYARMQAKAQPWALEHGWTAHG